MILKTADSDMFNLTMKLNVCYEGGYIDVIVRLTNKANNKVDMKSFCASNFDKAVDLYNKWREFFFEEDY